MSHGSISLAMFGNDRRCGGEIEGVQEYLQIATEPYLAFGSLAENDN